MAQRIHFAANDGSKVEGEIALPAGTGKAPGLVVIQEWWGVNDHIRSLVDRFAAEGFVALAPDLYHGVTPKDGGEAGKLMSALDGARALEDIRAAVHALLAHDRVNGKVGVTGFCMGGAYTLVATTRIPEVAAGVSFYGIPPAGRIDFKAHKPLMKHVATHDGWVTVPAAEKLKAEFEAHGGALTLHTYDAEHAFMNDTRPEVHNPEAAKLAWQRSVSFLHQHLDAQKSA
ncbi:MAG: dienelactone hydrolase family protein [Byssovorax sp.]